MKLLIVCCSASLGSASVAQPMRECPPGASALEARARESRANAEHAAGNYGSAGALYDESAQEYAECDKYHLRRMTAIERSTRAYERAHDAALQAGDHAAAHAALTRAIVVVIRYLDTLEHAYPGVAEHTEGHQALYARLVELRTRRAPGERAAMMPPSPRLGPASSGDALEPASDEAAVVETPTQTQPVDMEITSPKPADPEQEPGREMPRWRGLAAGGAISLAASIGAFTVMAVNIVRIRSLEREYVSHQCQPGAGRDPCATVDEDGKRANRLALTGLVTGPLLLGTGIALVILAARQRHAAPRLRPSIGPTSVGLTWVGRF
ncbi:hypothetical protein OV203_19505 [Nannocystis sp. ILAH1]|uniref:hypothetical protein n=1 Tax=unclassified Nannocystis TaxID=2627009 RepID=UPI002271B8A6|nr:MULTISPECIES: hypothetical protein [unclassified Nannocystis]MCY0989335.1 hypothetical protein [Nannocystis sp. ILAH1]MCY1064970.1 hypothetical protein [Nannocystis sp. RBIL2]